ncbi:hypothetical protein C8J57DRAFT_1445287 [Mycena rebaudengoi]|nr:hypothetical protein C8J57DRAFT_1445287 [Mycena rebaudengoi]
MTGEEEAPVRKEPRSLRDSDDPLRQWLEDHRDSFGAEFLRWEGRGDHHSGACPRNCGGVAEYRCKTCFSGGELLCRSCLLSEHRQLPFHQVERWDGSFFHHTTLKEAGLTVQLGHFAGHPHCDSPRRAPEGFVVIHEHRVEEIALNFCGCGGGPATVQLLRAGLYPATTTNPRTAATFGIMRHFHLMSFESKCSTYEFYHSLARESDNTGLRSPPDRYHEFLRMAREWRHLQMLKRAGRLHDPEGILSTKPGECALLCPACPHPGKNLPNDWDKAGEAKIFLYALFLAMDANFRLKRKDVSSEEKDPGLGPGWAFFCEVNTYMAHVKQHWDAPQDRSTCVSHDAVDKPDREARGTASSGIGAVDCARHNMKRPQAVGDLQLGERYINMDYMFFRSVQGSDLIRYFVSYDIACQWHMNIWRHMMQYQEDMWLVGEQKFVSFLVPKFHLPAHIEACNLRFSFNLTRDVGQTDGEALERGWANANPLANSTKEMGPGSRRDTLDDHFNDLNHKKIIRLAMLKKTENAIPEMVETRMALDDMEEMLGGAEGATVKAWTTMAEAWERDPDNQNPFESERKNEHLAQVQRELAEEAAAREAAKTEVPGAVRGDMHVTELLAMGLQLEEAQRTLSWDAAATGLHPTDIQRTVLVERTSKLRRRIVSWMEIQAQFFPEVSRLRDLEDAARARVSRTQPIQGVKVQDLPLWLPSSIHKKAGVSPCSQEVLTYEYRMRVGQAHEALHNMRRQLLVRTKLYKLKDPNAHGVAANTRANEKIDAINDAIRRFASAYRIARAALVVLGAALKRHDWEWTLKELKEEDVRSLPRATFADPDRQKGAKSSKQVMAGTRRRRTKKARLEAKTERAVSWIWIAEAQVVKEGDSPEMNEALRIEWAKARARCMRWREEVDLLEEEMRRVVQFSMWRSEWWKDQVGQKGLDKGAQLEGETAYALRQSAFQAALATNFSAKWAQLPTLIEEGPVGHPR